MTFICLSQIKEVQQTVADKTAALESEAFKTKRMHEETAILKRKVERLKKIEMASDMDEILKEEIREYKETLTCPSCKVKRKDAILTKCFHAFCYDCLRYDTYFGFSFINFDVILIILGPDTRPVKENVQNVMLLLEPRIITDCIYHKFIFLCHV